ncbi:hypothetical protein P171DRAFT_478144 [Karstenula rhodostoma CBS 690.94]|uniref:Uncharacterized protein n=1 Tax=Karstenula rhodostoma CBS 690.94 TaxID=1392251 RepID=A0A9P4P4X2_9PLEO|nr:hypothetical protein P171DRAFT_478144 [Karstenula rhodostoma CBS 690.94]
MPSSIQKQNFSGCSIVLFAAPIPLHSRHLFLPFPTMVAAAVAHQAVLRFGVPYTSVSVEERGLYAFPANESVKEHSFPLRDARIAPELLPGTAGIDAQGFAFVKHKSALQDAQDWMAGDAVEKTYIPEIEQLACDATGRTRAVVMDASFRLKPANKQGMRDAARYRRQDIYDLCRQTIDTKDAVARVKLD